MPADTPKIVTVTIPTGPRGLRGLPGDQGPPGEVTNAQLAATANQLRTEPVTLTRLPILDPLAHMADQVDRRIAGLVAGPTTKARFSTQVQYNNPASSSYIHATSNFFLRDVDLTACAVWNFGGGYTFPDPPGGDGHAQIGFTAITPRHVVSCHHSGPLVPGMRIRFVTRSNEIIERTVTARTRINNQVGPSDIFLDTLNADLPASIRPVSFFDDALLIQRLIEWPAISRHQYNQFGIRRLGQLGQDASFPEFVAPSPRAAWNEFGVTGDSGGGIFVIVDSALVMLSHFMFPTLGPGYYGFALEQIAALTSAAGYPLSYIKLPPSTSWNVLTDKPALTNAAITPAAVSPSGGQIPLTRPDGTLSPSVIPSEFGVGQGVIPPARTYYVSTTAERLAHPAAKIGDTVVTPTGRYQLVASPATNPRSWEPLDLAWQIATALRDRDGDFVLNSDREFVHYLSDLHILRDREGTRIPDRDGQTLYFKP